jgi:hypothetical protein
MKKNILILGIISLLILSIFSILLLQVKADTLSSTTGRNSILYAGGHNPGIVYHYQNGRWKPISQVLGYAVMDLIEFNGHLYAAVTTGFGGYEGVGKVYRYDGDKGWTVVGDGMDHAVISLAVYNGELYAGTGRGAFRLYKYTPGTTNCGIKDWTRVVDYLQWDGVRSLHVSRDYLLLGDTYWDRIGRWDGNNFYIDLDDGGSCIYDFQDFMGYVYAAAYHGRLWQSSDAISWSVVLDYYDGNMWELENFQNKLFMAYNNGELRAYGGTGDLRGELVYQALDGIISMATDGKYLYFGTGGDAVGYGAESTGIANVYRYDGTNIVLISDEDQFGEGVQVLYVAPTRGIDISFYTGEIERSTWEKIKQEGFEFVIVQAWGGQTKNNYAERQLRGAREVGMKTAAYCLLNFYRKDQSGEWQVKQALDAIGAEKNYIAFMAIDVELQKKWPITVGPIQRIREAVEAVKKAGLRAVIYTSKSAWQLITGNTKEFSNLPLWDAKWDRIADLNVNWVTYGGWTKRVGKQYWANTVLFGKVVDLDVFDPSYLMGDT